MNEDLFSSRLSKDLRLCVASFLSVSDASALVSTSRCNHDMIRYSTSLWEQWCFQRWPQLLIGDPSRVVAKVNDDRVEDDKNSLSPTRPDFYNVLRRASQFDPPTSLDTSSPSPRVTNQDIFDPLGPTTLRLRDDADLLFRNITVRSTTPLPRPKSRGKPFVWPFLKQANKVVLAPIHVSYFEISILPSQRDPRTMGRSHPDTVGIGLSFSGDMPVEGTCSCGMCGTFPGWDSGSVGYHGDDGRLYHSVPIGRHFGPTYGEGDTVGCGVDYQLKTIFFTLNGKFLHYVFEQGIVDLVKKSSDNDDSPPLFPIVGVERNVTNQVAANFGQREFMFDLCTYISQQKES